MNIVFLDKDLEELAEFGKCRKGRYSKIPAHISSRYMKTLNRLRSCLKTSDIMSLPGLRYEKLKGTDFESVRVNDQWRLIIHVVPDGIEISAIEIHKLSKHYE